MTRVTGVPELARKDQNHHHTDESAGAKRNPPAEADGLHVPGAMGDGAGALDRAFFEVVQARADVGRLIYAVEDIEQNRKRDYWRPFGPGERDEYLDIYRRAWRVYEATYARAVRDNFSALFGSSLSEFENALASMSEALVDTLAGPLHRPAPVIAPPEWFDGREARDD